MDKITVVLIIILLFILGIYGLSQISGGTATGRSVERSPYPVQSSGGGCGR